MRCVGIDVHRDFCEIAVHEAGRTRSLGRIETSQDRLRALAESLSAEDQVAIETTGNARRIAEILGVHASVLIVDTRNLRAITHAKLKNAGWTPAAWPNCWPPGCCPACGAVTSALACAGG